MKRIHLEIVVFVCGAVVMAYEIIGSRMLGPYVGTSYFVWTAIIGIILLSLSAGYYTGGWLSDQKPRTNLLALIILLAGIYILLTVFIKDPFLNFMIKTIQNLHWVSVLSSLVLFSIPSLLLGMVSPFAARLRMNSVASSGKTVGNLYALSTIGSIVGVFTAGFYLIPHFSISMILILFSIILITISLFLNLVYHLSLKRSQDEKV
ncbi:MAG: fused MFS/spermidine synthase [Bacteroidetes bacterium]|nr:fused MFS/spermidine synthase [Bacteroidota bacterium]